MSVQVPKGYKQTEVGVIPEDWEVAQLEELGKFSKGRGIRKDEASSGDIACVRYGEIYTHHHDYIRQFNSRISKSVALTSMPIKQGDILFAGSGETKAEIGKCVAFIHKIEAYAGGDILILSPKKDYSIFLGYLLNSPIVAKQKASKGQGDAVVHISANALATIKIPLPDINEQQAIAEALSDADALIESLEQLIDKKRQIKQGAMQELLTGQRRLPGFGGEWIQQRLGDIAHIKTGGRNNQDKVENGEFPFFVRSATVERINTFTYDCEAILVPGEGGIGSIFHYIFGKFDVHQRVYAITQFAGNVSGKFIYYYMKTYFGRHAMENSVKATVDSLRLPTFQDFVVKTPSCVEEQIEITSILSEMEQELEMLEERLQKARTIKQSMMQELLTGRIRLI